MSDSAQSGPTNAPPVSCADLFRLLKELGFREESTAESGPVFQHDDSGTMLLFPPLEHFTFVPESYFAATRAQLDWRGFIDERAFNQHFGRGSVLARNDRRLPDVITGRLATSSRIRRRSLRHRLRPQLLRPLPLLVERHPLRRLPLPAAGTELQTPAMPVPVLRRPS